MARITTLKDNEGNTLYPITSSQAVFDSQGNDLDTRLGNMVEKESGKGLSSNDYTNEDKQKLADLPTNEQLTTTLNGKQSALQNSEDITVNGNKLSVTDRAKRQLFIDQWNEACGTYGGYNAETGFFELNELDDITYEEALEIYSAPRLSFPTLVGLSFNKTLRTLIYVPSHATYVTNLWASFRDSNYETLLLDSTTYNALTDVFYNCKKLRAIYGTLTVGTIGNSCFSNMNALEEITINNLKSNVLFAESAKLSLSSLTYMVAHAANPTAITIMVHADVYAKINDEENEGWHNLLALATEKNIQFITS